MLQVEKLIYDLKEEYGINYMGLRKFFKVLVPTTAKDGIRLPSLLNKEAKSYTPQSVINGLAILQSHEQQKVNLITVATSELKLKTNPLAVPKGATEVMCEFQQGQMEYRLIRRRKV